MSEGLVDLDRSVSIYHLSTHTPGLSSSTSDLMRFARMFLYGGVLEESRILSPKTVGLIDVNHLDQKLVPIHFAGMLQS